MTQRDVARALGITHSTVSRALRNDLRISESRRKQVQAAAESMGYQSNPMAVALSHQRKASRSTPVQACLAWVNLWPEPEQLYAWGEFRRYHEGALEEARRDGYNIEEFCVAGDLPAARLQGILKARGIRGVLLPPSGGLVPSDWQDIGWEDFCVVRFGHSIPAPKFHLVSSDQVTDGIVGYDQMRRLGYRRIGLVRSRHAHTRFVAGATFQRQRCDDGFVCPELSLHVEDPEKDRERMRGWMEAYQPDAIFSGVPGTGALLQDLGYRIPEDVGLAVFSVVDGGADAGIDQNSIEIGKAAVQYLISLIHHHQSGIPEACRELLVEGRWQDGSTLPPVPARRVDP